MGTLRFSFQLLLTNFTKSIAKTHTIQINLNTVQYNLNGFGWNARKPSTCALLPLSRRKFANDDADKTDITRHSAGNDIDADKVAYCFIVSCKRDILNVI